MVLYRGNPAMRIFAVLLIISVAVAIGESGTADLIKYAKKFPSTPTKSNIPETRFPSTIANEELKRAAKLESALKILEPYVQPEFLKPKVDALAEDFNQLYGKTAKYSGWFPKAKPDLRSLKEAMINSPKSLFNALTWLVNRVKANNQPAPKTARRATW